MISLLPPVPFSAHSFTVLCSWYFCPSSFSPHSRWVHWSKGQHTVQDSTK